MAILFRTIACFVVKSIYISYKKKREYYEKKWEHQTKKRLGITLSILYIMISFISFF